MINTVRDYFTIAISGISECATRLNAVTFLIGRNQTLSTQFVPVLASNDTPAQKLWINCERAGWQGCNKHSAGCNNSFSPKLLTKQIMSGCRMASSEKRGCQQPRTGQSLHERTHITEIPLILPNSNQHISIKERYQVMRQSDQS